MENVPKLPVSALILTKNEQSHIATALASIAPLNPSEVLVIDDNSVDDTVSIAKSAGARTLTHTKQDFSQARNFAATQADSEWLLYLDADEQISPELVTEIRSILQSETKAEAYEITRINYYLGTPWPKNEKFVRLMQKKSLKNWRGELHETPDVEGEIAQLIHPIYHNTHRTLQEMLTKTILWSKTEAQLRFDAVHPPISWWRIPRMMLPTFFNYYILQRGFTVGSIGLIESIYQAFSIGITYIRLWELQQTQKSL